MQEKPGKDKFGIDWSREAGSRFWRRPALDRRLFFRHLGSAVAGYFMLPGRPFETLARGAGRPVGTAKNVIFVLMSGAPSHIDTFDLKEGSWTPAAFSPTSYGDLRWPQALLPKLAEQIDNIAIIRSARAWAVAHGLSQTWVQIGRNPLSGLSKIAPHIGSVVSRELRPSNSDNTLPTFISLNATTGPGEGYFDPVHAPFYNAGGAAIANTTHALGAPVFDRRYGFLLEMDAETRYAADITSAVNQMEQFNLNSRLMMYNSRIDQVFTLPTDERVRYGNTAFGNACLTARNLLRSRMGTRFVQITVGGWDNHANIYTTMLNAANAASGARQFDLGLGTLLADLKADGLLDETLIVAMGEFGRTVGQLNTTAGRDHHLQQSILVAGAKVKGGRAIGKTNDIGSDVVQTGWSMDRYIRNEDLEATIYSALGIDWTKVYTDDPLGRGFSLVPDNQGIEYGPVHELWS